MSRYLRFEMDKGDDRVAPTPSEPVDRRATTVRQLFSFPDPVNEVSARLVAGGVVVMAALTIGLHLTWAPYVIAAGFLARVLTGPKLSPLGQLVTRVITPRLRVAPRWVPGPPKRFAQGIGLVVTATASVFAALGLWPAAVVTLGLIIVAATLESVFAYCLGCKLFAVLIRQGLIPEDVCERCNNIYA
jgi:hypothetical protein